MYVLQRETSSGWAATVTTDSHLGPSGFHLDHGHVGTSLAVAVVAVRVVDLLLTSHHEDRYVETKRRSRNGRAVDGLTLLRNAEIHADDAIDVKVARVITWVDSEGASRCRIDPTWKRYEDLPEGARSTRTSQRCHDAYKEAVGGAGAFSVLMDSIAWFDACDARLAPRDAEGELMFFPLAPLVGTHQQRRHPRLASDSDIAETMRSELQERNPTGTSREISVRIAVPGCEPAFGGWTSVKPGFRQQFTERISQIEADLMRGYSYVVKGTPLEARAGVVWRGSTPLLDVGLPQEPAEGPTADVWLRWLMLAESDVIVYQRSRLA